MLLTLLRLLGLLKALSSRWHPGLRDGVATHRRAAGALRDYVATVGVCERENKIVSPGSQRSVIQVTSTFGVRDEHDWLGRDS